MEKDKIEKTILIYYKKYTLIVLVIILTLYIFNVNNHYKLFINENDKLRNEIKSQSIDLDIANRFIGKLLIKQDLAGHKFPFYNKQLIGNNFKVVYIIGTNSNQLSIKKTLKIIKRMELKQELKVINISDFNNLNKTINSKLIEKYFCNESAIFLLDKRNYVLSVFSIDGNEYNEEIELIIQYLKSQISK
jgi:hypothetical protein